jgi:hypothetical protein
MRIARLPLFLLPDGHRDCGVHHAACDRDGRRARLRGAFQDLEEQEKLMRTRAHAL